MVFPLVFPLLAYILADALSDSSEEDLDAEGVEEEGGMLSADLCSIWSDSINIMIYTKLGVLYGISSSIWRTNCWIAGNIIWLYE